MIDVSCSLINITLGYVNLFNDSNLDSTSTGLFLSLLNIMGPRIMELETPAFLNF